MTYAQMVIRRNGIRVHIEDSCSTDSSDLNVCPNPKPGPRLIRLAEIMADQRTVNLPPGHAFKVTVERSRSTMKGRTSCVVAIRCDRCDSKVETKSIRLNRDWSDHLLAHPIQTTWKVFEKADFGQTCKEARRLKKIRAIMDK